MTPRADNRSRSAAAAAPRSPRGLRPLRRLHAAGFVLLYALCALLAPALHLLWHRPDHEHSGGGLRLSRPGLVAGAEVAHAGAPHPPHRHDGAPHIHAHEPAPSPQRMALVLSEAGAPPAPASTWAAPARADGEPLNGLRHGLGSLAHFGAAYLSALDLPVVPAVAPALVSAPSLAPPSRPRLRLRDRATGARAPPCLRLAPSYELIS